MSKKQISIGGGVVIVVIIGMLLFIGLQGDEDIPTATSTPSIADTDEPVERIIGRSVQGRDITSYTYGDGSTRLVFVGAIHGGYEWNTVLLARRFMEYFDVNPKIIPDEIQVTIIPNLNPDGVAKVINTPENFTPADVPPTEQTTSGRFNANDVDLNRNFDCNWQPESTWRDQTVDAGSGAFSEPEARAIRDFTQDQKPTAVIAWHSAAGAVYGSQCTNGVSDDTKRIMRAYAEAAEYRAVDTFNQYDITGDITDWLSKFGIAAISVELETHEDVEFDRNLRGVNALFQLYTEQ